MIRTTIKSLIIAVSIAVVTTSTVISAPIEKTNSVIFTNDGFDIQEARLSQEISISAPIKDEIVEIENVLESERKEVERISLRADKIRTYLAQKNAPLANYAKEIVVAGEKHGVEPELIAAISIIESGGGKINFRPHNAWGWGRRSWSNWETAIDEYAQGLVRGYVSRGVDTPQKIAPIYCPPNSSYWARNVSHVLNEMRG